MVDGVDRQFRVATVPSNDDVDLGSDRSSDLELEHLFEGLVAFIGGVEFDSEERAGEGRDSAVLLVEMGDLDTGATIVGDRLKVRWASEVEEERGGGRLKVIDGKSLPRQRRDQLSRQREARHATHVER